MQNAGIAVGALFVLSLAACAASSGAEPDPSGLGSAEPTGAPVEPPPTSTPPSSRMPPVVPPPTGPYTPPPAPPATPHFVAYEQLCKLINGKAIDDPTPNQTHFRANLQGTDLGIPVAHGQALYFFFGDSVGYKGIWQFGESQPDAVGTASLADTKADPTKLCSNLRFLRLSKAGSLGPSRDARIEADFAPNVMAAPAGKPLSAFIKNPAGHGKYPSLPGDFEVPSGAFSYGGSIYVFYTTVNDKIEMKASYLAKWKSPDPNGVPAYDILYPVDQRFDAGGAMGGTFVNVAAEIIGDYVYAYGTGAYRASPVYLARKKLVNLEAPGGFEKYDPKAKTWVPSATSVDPVVTSPYNGEVSVRWYPEIQRMMMISQEGAPTSNRIVARFAPAPEGPWSADVVVHDMADPVWRQKHCCTANACNGEQMFHCDRAGFYAPYLLPFVEPLPSTKQFRVTYTMSTWDPYNVVLMRTTFAE